jgi:glycosyltransferase involved in cell wall biosynthesis
MRSLTICILGPVESDKYFGGVATFTESLADGFHLLGHTVRIITDYSIKATTVKGVPIEAVADKPLRRGLALPWKVSKALAAAKPDFVISSLEYGLAIPIVKKKLPNTLFFHYLHAFPALTTGSWLKKILLNRSMKIIQQSVHKMIANSSVTAIISTEIYGIRVDEIISVGLGFDIIENVKPSVEAKQARTILYAGRLAKEKNIPTLIDGMVALHQRLDKNWTMLIAGGGPEKDIIQQKVEQHKLPVKFLGQLKPAELSHYYQTADVFVSMNPHEPFGITYLEALYSQCKIVCPMSGGQIDIVLHYPRQFTLVNPYSPASIADGIHAALQKQRVPVDTDQLIHQYGYEHLAKQLVQLYR